MRHKRRLIRTVSYISSLVLVLGIFAITENYKRREYERLISISQQSSLSELGRYLENIELSLTKGMYANTAPMIANLASALWRDATGAKTTLAQLNTGESTLANIYKYLSQVGEFTMSLNRKVADGEKISAEEREKLKQLHGYAKGLCEQLDYMQLMLQNNNFDFEKTKSTLSSTHGTSEESPNFIALMDDAEQTLADYPVLLYDGPFADNIDQIESELLKKHNEINEDEAKELAAKYAQTESAKLTLSGTEDGKIPAYVFTGNNSTISVSKRGGLLIYMLGDAYAGEETIAYNDAVEKTKAYLDKHGFKNMKESYHATTDGICTVNFAYTLDDITYYPDLVKVSIALDSGNIVSVDARGYTMNHHERELDAPAFSIEEGAAIINEELSVKNMRSTVIPKSNGEERYAYEYHCVNNDGQEALIYIDTKSGNEEKILLLTYADGGVLTK